MLGSVKVVLKTMKQNVCNIVLHTILVGTDDIVLNTVLLRERRHYMEDNMEWHYSCGMGKTKKGVLHQWDNRELFLHSPKSDRMIIHSNTQGACKQDLR